MASIPLSPRITAADAIGPAFNRTFSLLAKPFRIGVFLKKTLIAGIAEISYLGMVLGLPIQIIQILVMSRMPTRSGASSTLAHPQIFMGIMMTVFGLFGLAIMTFLLYFFCRLRFVVLDFVLFGQDSVGEAWRKYGRPTWRYFGLTLLLAIAVLLLVVLVAGPMVPLVMRITQSMDPTRPESMRAFFSFFFPYMGIMLGLGLVIYVIDGIVRDLFLPPMALADEPIEGCFRRFFQLLLTEPGDTFLYVLLRTVLGVVFQWATSLAVVIPTVVLGGAGALVGVVMYRSLWRIGPGGRLLFIAYVASAALVLLVLYFVGIFIALGCSGIFKQTYAVTWLSTRYPELSTIVYGAPAPVESPHPMQTDLPPTPPPDIAPPLLG